MRISNRICTNMSLCSNYPRSSFGMFRIIFFDWKLKVYRSVSGIVIPWMHHFCFNLVLHCWRFFCMPLWETPRFDLEPSREEDKYVRIELIVVITFWLLSSSFLFDMCHWDTTLPWAIDEKDGLTAQWTPKWTDEQGIRRFFFLPLFNSIEVYPSRKEERPEEYHSLLFGPSHQHSLTHKGPPPFMGGLFSRILHALEWWSQCRINLKAKYTYTYHLENLFRTTVFVIPTCDV